MPKTLPSTAVEIIEYFHGRLQIVPMNMAARQASIEVNDDCAVILSTIVEIVADLPDELLQVSTRRRAQLYAALHDLRHAIVLLNGQSLESRLAHGFPRLGPMRWLDDGPSDIHKRYPTEVICDVLKNCPDEVIRASTKELPFITDANLRDSLRLDLSSVNSALENGEYKAATVLGGSIIEALLLWGISEKSLSDQADFVAAAKTRGLKKLNPDINRWDLYEFITVAEIGNLIERETVTIATLAKDFRNLIHPGRVQRLGQTCNRATALVVVAAVESVIGDLTKTPPQH